MITSHARAPEGVGAAGGDPVRTPLVDAAAVARRPIRVLHFHSSKGLFGPERWTHLVLRSVPRERVHLEVLTIGSKAGYDDFARFLTGEGFTATHVATSSKLSRGVVDTVRRHLEDRRIDVLHTHGFKTDVIGFLAARATPVGLVTTPHGWCDQESFRIRAYETIGRAFLRGFDRIYPLSDHQTTFLNRRRMLRSRVRRIRNAVDIEAFTSIFERRMATPLGPRGPLLFVGRVGREKGILDALRAFALLAPRFPELSFVIVGTGPDEDAAAALANELGIARRTEFLGFCADVRPLYERARALVLPSYSEGIPRVVMEAFSAGVPVVGTDIPGIRELVRDGRTGMLAPVGDATRLAAALEGVLRDGERARELAVAARATIEAEYAPRRLADELCEEYEALVHNRRGGRGAGSRDGR